MSYNIDTFKLKSLSLTFPRDFDIGEFIVKKVGNESWRDDILVEADLKTWSFREDEEGLVMRGEVDGENFVVTELECDGEFSGTLYRNCLLPMLRKFKGDIEAVCIWEGGGSIQRLISRKGEITETDIEL
jgi:hypothetical protein